MKEELWDTTALVKFWSHQYKLSDLACFFPVSLNLDFLIFQVRMMKKLLSQSCRSKQGKKCSQLQFHSVTSHA